MAKKLIFSAISLITLLHMGAGLFAAPALAASLMNRNLIMSNSNPGQVSSYEIAMTLATPATLGSIEVLFCSDYALLAMPCSPPVGFDISGAIITGQSGATGFSIDPATDTNRLILTRLPSATTSVEVVIKLDNVINQSTAGSGYARYLTYSTDDASGTPIDGGAVAYSLAPSFMLNAEVPPYITICAATSVAVDCSSQNGNLVQMGSYKVSEPSFGQSQVSIATNAANGYTLRVLGTSMTSGNNLIPALSTNANSAPGTSQFGINLRANSNPSAGADPDGVGSGFPIQNYGIANSYRYNSGDIIVNNAAASNFRRFTITYLVNISKSQPAGVYSSSFSYVALGNF